MNQTQQLTEAHAHRSKEMKEMSTLRIFLVTIIAVSTACPFGFRTIDSPNWAPGLPHFGKNNSATGPIQNVEMTYQGETWFIVDAILNISDTWGREMCYVSVQVNQSRTNSWLVSPTDCNHSRVNFDFLHPEPTVSAATSSPTSRIGSCHRSMRSVTMYLD